MPEFWLGMLLILGFAVALDWFPTSFMTTPGLTDASAGVQLVDTLEHLFLPALTLVLALLGEYALIMRSSVIEAMNEDYVTTARAKGMREALVLRKHVVPNALLPVVTLAALNLGFIVAGAITVETVFSWPGLGQLTFRAINGGPDYPLLQGLFLLFSVAVIFANLAADLLLGVARPQDRTRVSAQATRSGRAVRRTRRIQAFKSSARLFARNKMGVAGLMILTVFTLIALFADVLVPEARLSVTNAPGAPLEPPSAQFWLGTDELGRSVLDLVIQGSQISLLVGFLATALSRC